MNVNSSTFLTGVSRVISRATLSSLVATTLLAGGGLIAGCGDDGGGTPTPDVDSGMMVGTDAGPMTMEDAGTLPMEDGGGEPVGLHEAPCFGMPDGQEVPFFVVDTGMALPSDTGIIFWDQRLPDIAVSYDARLASFAELISLAAAHWNAIECGGPPISTTPTQTDTRPDAATQERRIHFFTDDSIVGMRVFSLEPNYYGNTGVIYSAVIGINPEELAGTTEGDITKYFGYILGLDAPAGEVDSIMALGHQTTRTEPTALDTEAFCNLYGNPAYCVPPSE